jgi:hypothetical protein
LSGLARALATVKKTRYDDAQPARAVVGGAPEQKKETYMVRSIFSSRPVWLGLGVAVGLAVAWYVVRLSPPAPLWATTTHSTDNLIAATGFVESDAEAVIFLDAVTGELTAHVINTNTGKLFASFNQKSVTTDVGAGAVKNPKYTLVTGVTNFKPFGTNRMASLVIYVAEETTGQFVAYGVPWPGGAMTRPPAPKPGAFVKITTGKTSFAPRRAAAEGG